MVKQTQGFHTNFAGPAMLLIFVKRIAVIVGSHLLNKSRETKKVWNKTGVRNMKGVNNRTCTAGSLSQGGGGSHTKVTGKIFTPRYLNFIL